jgi:hypothetical protein
LVNLTNPMMMKGPIREFFPTGAMHVSVRLPEGTRAKKVQLLASGHTVRVEQTGGVVSVTIPQVVDHEVVAIDL